MRTFDRCLCISRLDTIENLGIYETYMHFVQIAAIGKKAPVWKGTNFDARLYDIITFSDNCVFSIYLYLPDI